jgi:hypothetical protein
MSLRECIINGSNETRENGKPKISQRQRDEAVEYFDEYKRQLMLKLPEPEADKEAGKLTFSALEKQARDRNRRKIMQLRAQKQALLDIKNFRSIGGTSKEREISKLKEKAKGIKDPKKLAANTQKIQELEKQLNDDIGIAAQALFAKDERAKFADVETLQTVYLRKATRKLDKILGSMRRNILGQVRKKAQMENVVREMLGTDTGDAAAREMGEALAATFEDQRLAFNRMGGSIGKLEGGYFPVRHDMMAVRGATKDEWIQFMMGTERANGQAVSAPTKDARPGLIDIDNMIDNQTGLPFTPERLEVALGDMYEAIVSNNATRAKATGSGGQGSLATTRADHRFIKWKNADAFLEYHERFGGSELFDVAIGHIQSMSRDLALLERLGPNPNTTKRYIQQYLQQQADLSQDVKLKDTTNGAVAKIDTFYEYNTGANLAPISSRWGNTFAGIRDILQSSQLGSAFLSASGDLATQNIARASAGIPQIGTLAQYLRGISPLGATEKGQLAVRLGLVADGWSQMASAQARFVGEMVSPEVTSRISDFVMRASLLSTWTQAGRWAFGQEFLGFLADNVGKTFDELPSNLRRTMEQYQIGSDKWDIMRATELYEYNGAKFLRAEDIANRTDVPPTLARTLETDLMRMIETETNFAVPSSSLRGAAMLRGSTRPGSFGGELLNSFAMYKQFPVTLMNTHLMRGVAKETRLGKMVYLSHLMLAMTAMGALSYQLKEVAKGRNPMEMFNEDGEPNMKFWGRAALQGGGLGLYGDFLFSDLNVYGRGLADQTAGPVVGLMTDVRNLTLGNVSQYLAGDDVNFGKEAVGMASRYFPGNNIWYTRLAFERLVRDNALRYVDPKADARFRRLQRKYAREYGQEYWWAPGKSQPGSRPDLSTMIGTR